MADVWNNTVTNWLRDLAVYKARTGKITMEKVREGKVTTGTLTHGKAS